MHIAPCLVTGAGSSQQREHTCCLIQASYLRDHWLQIQQHMRQILQMHISCCEIIPASNISRVSLLETALKGDFNVGCCFFKADVCLCVHFSHICSVKYNLLRGPVTSESLTP